MGCINANSKKSPQENLSNQELSIVNAWKIKCLEPKNSKTFGNEHLRTHDSIAQDHSVEFQSHLPYSPQNPHQSIGLSVATNDRDLKPKDGDSINSTEKMGNKFLVNGLKNDQTTCQEDKMTRYVNERSEDDKNVKKGYVKMAEANKKVQEINDSAKVRTRYFQGQKSDKVAWRSIQRQIQLSNPFKEGMALGQISAGQIRNKKRAKRAGFRSPRGRSENLFKTFEDDYIEQQNQPQISKKESQSMGRIAN